VLELHEQVEITIRVLVSARSATEQNDSSRCELAHDRIGNGLER
jgi:hypothetical protein